MRVCTEGGPRRRAGRDPGEGPRWGARRPIVWACAPASAVLCVRGRGFVCSLALGSPAAAPIGRSSSECLCVVCCGQEEGRGRGDNSSHTPSSQTPGCSVLRWPPQGLCPGLRGAPSGLTFLTWDGSYLRFLPLLPGLWLGRREMKEGRTWALRLFSTGPESSTFICHPITPTRPSVGALTGELPWERTWASSGGPLNLASP